MTHRAAPLPVNNRPSRNRGRAIRQRTDGGTLQDRVAAQVDGIEKPVDIPWMLRDLTAEQAKAEGLCTRQQLADHTGVNLWNIAKWHETVLPLPEPKARQIEPGKAGNAHLYSIAELAQWWDDVMTSGRIYPGVWVSRKKQSS